MIQKKILAITLISDFFEPGISSNPDPIDSAS
jgi:hypothetical protein